MAGNRATERQFDSNKLRCHPPAVMLTAHTLTILGIHIAHLAYIKAILIDRNQGPPTVTFCSLAGGHYIGRPTASSNTLCNI